MDQLFVTLMSELLHQTGLLDLTLGNLVMITAGCVLLYLGIIKKYEPFLLVGIGFSCIVANVPGSTLTAPAGFSTLRIRAWSSSFCRRSFFLASVP